MLRLGPLLLVGGCSFAFVRGPAEEPDCTSSPVLPIVDSAIAATALTVATVAATAFARHESDGSVGADLRRDTNRDTAIVAASTGLLYTGSAIYGFHRIRACRSSWR